MHMVTAMAPSARENGLLRLQVGKTGRFDIRFPSPILHWPARPPGTPCRLKEADGSCQDSSCQQ